ncbi:MAG: glycosyltransferase family 4 protein [Anaerolineae bacterium]
MRIAMIGPFGLRPKGTMGARALPLARALAAQGYQVALFLPPWSCPEDSGKAWEVDGVMINNVALPTSPAGVFHAQLTQRLVQAALAMAPDVIHCFKPKAYSGLAQSALWSMRQARRWTGRLVVDEDDWEGAGGWNNLENYPWAMKQTFARQESWGLRHADTVTVASRALETIAWSLGVPPRQVAYIPNGAAEAPPPGNAEAARERWGLDDAPIVLLYTRFFEYKVERIVDVFTRIHTAAPETRFLVVGEGLFGEERELLARLDRVEPSPYVVYAGWPGDAALPDIFAAADLALYPLDDTLVNRTKSPAKLLQLLGAGVPVVADAVGQATVYVAPGVAGLLVPPCDDVAMAEAAVDILRDPWRRHAMSAGARAWVAQHYTWPRLAERLAAAYRGETLSPSLP